jgi:hypothetical protein
MILQCEKTRFPVEDHRSANAEVLQFSNHYCHYEYLPNSRCHRHKLRTFLDSHFQHRRLLSSPAPRRQHTRMELPFHELIHYQQPQPQPELQRRLWRGLLQLCSRRTRRRRSRHHRHTRLQRTGMHTSVLIYERTRSHMGTGHEVCGNNVQTGYERDVYGTRRELLAEEWHSCQPSQLRELFECISVRAYDASISRWD